LIQIILTKLIRTVPFLLRMSSFSLKGSGWYATDYGGKKSPAPAAAATESEATAPADKSSSTGETATASTSGNKED
jgi:hypothetical protein